MGRADLRIRSDQFRGLVRLINESREQERAGEDVAHPLLRGICQLIDADVGVLFSGVGLLPLDPERPAQLRRRIDFGWRNDRDADRIFRFVVEEGDPATVAVQNHRFDRPRVFLRRELVEDSDWYECALSRDIHRPLRLDDVIFAVHTLEPGGNMEAAVLKRRWGARPFTRDERDLVQLWVEESGAFAKPKQKTAPACTTPADVAATSGLTRRERETACLLLRGNSEKEVGSALGLSTSTVHGYVKSLYRKLGITKRSELFARFAAK